MTRSGFHSAAQAAAARAKVAELGRVGRWPANPLLTVGEWVQGWYAAKVSAGALRPTTARCYRQHVEDYLVPCLGSVRLCRLRGSQITAMYAAIVAEHDKAIADAERTRQAETQRAARAGCAPRQVRWPRSFGKTSVTRLHATLHAALNAAVRAGEIPFNPAKHAELPRGVRAKVVPWSPAEYGVFLDYLQDTGDPMAELFRVAGHTGLRRGELCGLRWSDVDLRQRVLVVRRQVVEAAGGLVVGKPKTRRGEDRVVDLDVGTVRMLRVLRARQQPGRAGSGSADSAPVFASPEGTPWHPATVTHRFRRLTELAGVRRCRLHDLRHLAASLQLGRVL